MEIVENGWLWLKTGDFEREIEFFFFLVAGEQLQMSMSGNEQKQLSTVKDR